MTANDSHDCNDAEHAQDSETATEVAEGHIGSTNRDPDMSHERPTTATRQSSDKQREPYSVFTSWDRYAIVAMASLASLYRCIEIACLPGKGSECSF